MNHKMYNKDDMKEEGISFDDTRCFFEDEYDMENIAAEENMRHSDDDMDCMIGSSDDIMYDMFDGEQYCPMLPYSNNPYKGMPYMVEIEDDDDDNCDDINEILKKMEKKNPEIFTFMAAYGIPLPIIKKTLKRIIRLTLMYK